MGLAFFSFATLFTPNYALNHKKCQDFFRKKVKIGFFLHYYTISENRYRMFPTFLNGYTVAQTIVKPIIMVNL